MNIPGFTAELSLRAMEIDTGKVHHGRWVPCDGISRIVGQASMIGVIGRGRGAGFTCGPGSCSCAGTDDCLDLFITTGLCGPHSNCTYLFGIPFCTCTRN